MARDGDVVVQLPLEENPTANDNLIRGSGGQSCEYSITIFFIKYIDFRNRNRTFLLRRGHFIIQSLLLLFGTDPAQSVESYINNILSKLKIHYCRQIGN